jgi:CheY-like chemotaxis protein
MPDSDSRPARVLLVDDTPANLRLLEAICRAEGYDPVSVTNGPDALAVTRGPNPPDLVLLDVVMDGMDGYAVCRAIRHDHATEHLPVVMVTANGDEPRGEAFEAGADEFIPRPFERAELLARVRPLLHLGQPGQPHRQALRP